MAKTIINYAIGLPLLFGVSIFCNLSAFYTLGLTAWFLPISTVVIILFLLFGAKIGLAHLISSDFIGYLSSAVFLYSIGIFIFGLLCWLMAFLDINYFSEKARFPLSEIDWIAVDREGSVYCLSFVYLRLQVFDSEGKFLKGWFVHKPTGIYQVSLSEEGDVVFGKEGKAYYVYDQTGNRKPLNDKYCESLNMPSTKITDNERNTYDLKSASIRPRIVKTDKNGNQFTLIKDPFGLWLHTMPLPAIGFLILTAVLRLIMVRLK